MFKTSFCLVLHSDEVNMASNYAEIGREGKLAADLQQVPFVRVF